MTRMIVGLSVGVLVCLAGTSACSSDSVDGEDDKGGSGSVLAGGSGGASGTPGTGGSTGGTGGTAGGAVGCPGMPISCVDAMNAKACNPNTNMVDTVNCAEQFAEIGLISDGCTTEPAGSGCTLDGGEDEVCWQGAQGLAVCDELTNDEFINVYVNCFTDMNDVRPLLTCINDFVDPAAMTVDCPGAVEACAEGAGGAPPTGEGGAPPTGEGGVGGAP